MPTAALQPCREPGCAALVSAGYCERHRVEQPRTTWRRWYAWARWRHPVYGLRAEALRRYPCCVDCWQLQGKRIPSTDVDHEVPHRGDPRLFWDLENLRGRCHQHHSEKTNRGL